MNCIVKLLWFLSPQLQQPVYYSSMISAFCHTQYPDLSAPMYLTFTIAVEMAYTKVISIQKVSGSVKILSKTGKP